ncbi:N-acetylglutaminylglutamine amidotransferase [Rhodopseudomonas sp. WA056]|uniref:N-acetylglutaminylglutamine amidotransferase n=1 Tax=Rhodopseudomonas sp. WA056 TaxID=2269367 RepID=UPI0013E05463|nr:N-acetylglutaminylglutamine amidotransferase [Rhodopseudomonas sp. WA056]NEW90094.1 N-acetylglutaminylglutamine amidotransferase [Rhodopseudomonas sp. WA056]
MCGICGEIRMRGEPSIAALKTIAGAMHKRGPDAEGLFAQGTMAFGHRRLSILDLAAASQQPMIDSELGLSIVFNGCIYNFRELRDELTRRGYRFFSQGDTEVILKSYHAWGADCVSRFKGMFAFALWERDSGRVVLARDRLGIKPLYYVDGRDSFRFASDLPALLAGGDVDTSLDPVALHHFFSFHGAVPPPRTILRGVKKLEPATILTLEPDGSRTTRRYWSFTVGSAVDRVMTEQEWSEAVTDAMLTAVDRRRVADVPVGVLLSGGLDSSLIVALLAKLGHSDVKTFAIGFDSVGGQSGDEFYYSDLVAKHFSSTHEQIRIDGREALQYLPDAIRAMSEPMVSHDAVAFYLLSREVAKRVTVVQSGQGADEVFGGYSWYPSLLTANNAADQYREVYFDWKHTDIARLLTPDLLSADHSSDFVERFFDLTSASSPVDKALQIDAEIMMVDDPVKRVDNMTMAHGLEARVPFLDHDVVELAARIPAPLKLGDGGKYILKQAARALLPTEVIDRPKGYFPVPSLRHLRGDFLDYVRDILTSPAARSRGLYRSEFIEHMLHHPEAEKSPKGHSRLWQAALLEGWLQAHAI